MAKGRLKGRIKSAVKKAADKTKSTVKKLKDTGGLAVLLPFKQVMVNALKKKGESVSMSTKMDKLVPLFHDRIILKKTKINYEDLEHVGAAAVLALVPVVLGFIQELIKRKKEGKAINEEESEILRDAERSADEIAVKGTDAKTDSNWFKDNMIVILGATAVILFLVFRKK